MPNDATVKGKGWKSFRVSVRQVERETGLNFLSNVPVQVQQVIFLLSRLRVEKGDRSQQIG
jgi:DNA/RNA endonuclease G (NUC1)